jgi:uncharacterized membrane protein YphA (DoxX/SURF4 family)
MIDKYTKIIMKLEKQVAEFYPTIVRVLFGFLWLGGFYWKFKQSPVGRSVGQFLANITPDWLVSNNFLVEEGAKNFWQTDGGLYFWTNLGTKYPIFAPYTWLLNNIILPNFAFFAFVTVASELLIAVSLLSGYKTKLMCYIAFAQSVAIGLSVAKSQDPKEWYWTYVMLGMVSLLLAFNSKQAEKYISISWLKNKLKKSK